MIQVKKNRERGEIVVSFENLKLDDCKPVYLQLAEHVKRQILMGVVENGETLPSRREIAIQAHVNPNTVQKACRFMEQEGYVSTKGNRLSVIQITPKIRQQIQDEMTIGLCQEFVDKARRNNLSYKHVIALISELWEE